MSTDGWHLSSPLFTAHSYRTYIRNGATVRVDAMFRQDTSCAVGYDDPRNTEVNEADEALDSDLLTDLGQAPGARLLDPGRSGC
eukprot:7469378-Pyramimonas_sp.AAC.1